MSSEFSIPSLPNPEHYSRIRLRAEQLATFVNSPDAKEMLESGTMNPLRALVIRAVMATPGLPGFLYEQIGAPGYRRAGFDILGIGFHAVTVSDGDALVRKYYRRTAGASESFQNETILAWEAKQALIIDNLEEYAVPQVFEISENPLNSQESIVTATQARIASTDSLNIFEPGTIPKSALPFLQASQQMRFASTPIATPDIIGKNNVLVAADTQRIKLIDPIALVRDDPNDALSYQKAVSFLDEFLESV